MIEQLSVIKIKIHLFCNTDVLLFCIPWLLESPNLYIQQLFSVGDTKTQNHTHTQQIGIHMCTRTRMQHMYTHTRIHTHAHTQTHTLHTHTHTHTHTLHMHARMHARIRTRTHTHTKTDPTFQPTLGHHKYPLGYSSQEYDDLPERH